MAHRRGGEPVRNSGALLGRKFTARTARSLLQQLALNRGRIIPRQRALALAVAALFLGRGEGHPGNVTASETRPPAAAGRQPGY